MGAALVDVEGLVHIYRTDELEVVALQGLDLQVAEREMIAIVGRSGSGVPMLAERRPASDREARASDLLADEPTAELDGAASRSLLATWPRSCGTPARPW